MTNEQPKLHSYAAAFYAEMVDNADEQIIRGNKYIVWNGFIGETCRKLDIPKGTENRILKPLTDMGCIEVLVRGATSHPTVIVLFKPPTEELWEQIRQTPSLTRAPSLAKMRVELRDIQRQLGGVNLTKVVKNFEDRISKVEDFLEKTTDFDRYS